MSRASRYTDRLPSNGSTTPRRTEEDADRDVDLLGRAHPAPDRKALSLNGLGDEFWSVVGTGVGFWSVVGTAIGVSRRTTDQNSAVGAEAAGVTGRGQRLRATV